MSISLTVVGRCAPAAFPCVYLRLSAQAVWFEPNQGQVHRPVQFLARPGADPNQIREAYNKPVRVNA